MTTSATTIDLTHAFGLPPKEATEYFRAKGMRPSWHYTEVWEDAHARAFTVAKALRSDVLSTIREEVDRAIAEGTTFAEFQKTLTPRLQKLGWWGRPLMGDGKGSARTVQLGSPRRLRTIYRTNLQTAYMSGRYQGMVQAADTRPYWQYIAIMDSNTRPGHAALHERVYAWDDPFWDSFYPPNGWGCRCRVRSLSERSMEKRGLKVQKSGSALGQINEPGMGDRGRVATMRLGPSTVVKTDPGWAYNPGKAGVDWRNAKMVSDAKAVAEAFNLPAGFAPQTWETLSRPSTGDIPVPQRMPMPKVLPSVASRTEATGVVAEALGFQEGQEYIYLPTFDGDKSLWTRKNLKHMVAKEAREKYANLIAPTLQNPYEIWLKEIPLKDGGYVWRKQYIGVYTGEGKRPLLVSIEIDSDGQAVGWNFMQQRRERDLDDKREGYLLFGR